MSAEDSTRGFANSGRRLPAAREPLLKEQEGKITVFTITVLADLPNREE